MKHLPRRSWAALLVLGLLAGCQEQYVHIGPNWDALQKLTPDKYSITVEVQGSSSYRVGKSMSFTVRSEKNGQLWVVGVDPSDEVNLLYPNNSSSDNGIRAGDWVSIPPQGANWSLQAEEPAGASMIAFIVTTGDMDISEILEPTKKSAGKAALPKAVRLVEQSPAWGVGKQVVKIGK